MTGAGAGTSPPRTFEFRTAGARPAGAVPLACVAGGLIVDSGEEDVTFVFRCQDRYPVYTALAGFRSVLFVLDDAHAALYDERLADLGRRLDLVRARTGVLGSLAVEPPLYVGCDPLAGRVRPLQVTKVALEDEAVRASVRAGLHLNQPSPTYARLLAGLAELCAAAGVEPAWDPDAVAAQAGLCHRAYDKADYVALVAGHGGDLAPHVETAVVAPADLFARRGWADLVALLPRSAAPRRLHVKSTLDSGGNVAATIGPDDVGERLAALERELGASVRVDHGLARRKVRENWILGPLGVGDDLLSAALAARAEVRARHDVRLLVQPRVEPPAGAAVSSVGCSYAIEADGSVTPFATAQQVFVDRDRRKHIGALLSGAADEAFAEAGATEAFAAVARLYAGRGYRGPISFDTVLDGDGRYAGVYDCNPRLTAVLPALAVRAALRAEGAAVGSIVNLDYRGIHTWPDPAARLDALDEAGLLCTSRTRRGVLPLPNMARPHAFDMHLVDLTAAEVGQVLASGLLGPADDFDKGEIRAVYT